MKKIKLLLSTCFLAVLSLFGIDGSVSASEVTTTTEAPATTTEAPATTTEAKDKVTSYVRYASIYDMITEKYTSDNVEIVASLEEEIKSLKTTYDNIELVTVIQGKNGVLYYVNVSDAPYNNYVLADGMTEAKTNVYMLATLKNKTTRLLFDAPADLTTEKVVFTKHNSTTTIELSKNMIDSYNKLAGFYFKENIKKYDTTSENLNQVTEDAIKYNAKTWYTTPKYTEGEVFACLKVLKDAGIKLPMEIKQNAWEKIKDAFVRNKTVIMTMLSIVLACGVAVVLVVLGGKLYKWIARR